MTDKYVIAGEWKDQEWLDLASGYKASLDATTKAPEHDNSRYWAGPRNHPFGPLAVTIVVDGKPRVYPSQQHAIDDGAVSDTSAPAPHDE